jgi:hypothetical protein
MSSVNSEVGDLYLSGQKRGISMHVLTKFDTNFLVLNFNNESEHSSGYNVHSGQLSRAATAFGGLSLQVVVRKVGSKPYLKPTPRGICLT